jgi:phosphoglycolate phosphatase-like HAD superfamily hydrolase
MLLPLQPWDIDWIARLRQQLARHHITTLGAGVFARLDEPTFRGSSGLGLLERFDAYASELPGMLPIAGVFGRSSRFWQFCTDLFQQWYLGDELYEQVSGHPPAQPGKIGCIHLEEPLLPLEHLRATLEQLCRQGYTLGVATGRPGREATMPLKQYGLYDYFDQQRIVTHKEVELAEAELRRRGDNTLLVKPHPYQFLRAADPTYVLGDPLPARGSFVVVGDSTSDVLGARAANALMLAVYTGALTAEARDLLEQSQPDHLLADVTQVPDLLAWLGKKAEVMGTDEQCK